MTPPCIPIKLPCLSDFDNLGLPSVQEVLGGTGDCVLIDMHNFFTIYVFEIKETIADTPRELLCLGDFDNEPEVVLDFRSHPNMIDQ